MVKQFFSSPNGLSLSDDGKSVFICGSTLDAMAQIMLDVPWKIHTGHIYPAFLRVVESYPTGIHTPSGSNIYILGSSLDRVQQFSTIETSSFTGESIVTIAG